MKKLLSVLIIIVMLAVGIFALTGCGKEEPTGSSKKDNNTNESKITETSENEELTSKTTNNWKDFYNEYTELSENAYNKISEESNSFGILNFISGDIDLAYCSSFFTDNEVGVKGVFSVFGYTDVNYIRESKVETVTGKNSKGEKKTYKLEFDNQLAKFTLESPEGINSNSIYIKGDKWARSYSSKSLTVQIYQDGEDIYFGYDTTGGVKYIDADKVTKDSVTAMPKVMKLVDGTYTEK